MKNKPGRPKKDNPKKQITLRLNAQTVGVIKSKDNQSKYIENLVEQDATQPH